MLLHGVRRAIAARHGHLPGAAAVLEGVGGELFDAELPGPEASALAGVSALETAEGKLRNVLPYDPTKLTFLTTGQIICTASKTTAVELAGEDRTAPAGRCSDHS